MKAILTICILASNAMAAQPLVARITPDALGKLQQADPMIRLQKPAEGAIKVERPLNQSIISQSTILSDGTRWTIVPIGAVLHIPENLKSRVNAEATGELLLWSEFLTANRAWITTCEMSFEQAAGKTPLPTERSDFWPKQEKLVVAVHQSGPISVRPTE